MTLTTSVLHDDGVALLALDGELDLSVVEVLHEAVAGILADGLHLVLIDLNALVFCDSAGLGALVQAARDVRDAGGTCVVAGARGPVERLLALTSMRRTLNLVPEVQPALRTLRAASSDSPS
jgi:anti-anti-sigma factor